MGSTLLESREELEMPVERYVVLLIDLGTGELLDYTRESGFSGEEAYELASRLYASITQVFRADDRLGAPIEVDVMTDRGYVKLVIDSDASLLRAFVSELSI